MPGINLNLGLGLGLSPVIGGAAPASPLPTSSARATTLLGTNISNYSTNIQLVPSGDWSAGASFKAISNAGVIMSAGSNTGNNSFCVHWDATQNMGGSIGVMGTDGSGNTIGSQLLRGQLNAVVSTDSIKAGDDVFVHVQKKGSTIEIWLGLNGHLPVLSASALTDYAGQSVAGPIRIGLAINGGSIFNGNIRDVYFISQSYSEAEIGQIMRSEAYPHAIKAAAANDFFFPMATLTNPRQEITSGKTWFNEYGTTTAGSPIGYAYDQSEAVYMSPVGSTYKVFQHTNGFANVPVSGKYIGSHGGNIQAQVIDSSNRVVVPWQTVATSISGGIWSGTISNIPKKKSWLRVQLRKVISGTPSTQVMTAAAPFGVGETYLLCGQSLAEHMRETNPNALGATGTMGNGNFVLMIRNGFSTTLGTDAQERIAVSSIASNGGLVEVTLAAKHGLRAGQKVGIYGVTGTTEANGLKTVTPTSPYKFTINGSTFVNAYVSGGYVAINQTVFKPIANSTDAAAMTTMGNALSNAAGCVVAIANRAINGSGITFFYDINQKNTVNMLLEADRMGNVGNMIWFQGHGNSGAGSPYWSDGGSAGAYTGWGMLGALLDYVRANINPNMTFGEVPFTAVGGTFGGDGSGSHPFRFGMYDWVVRKRAAGDDKVYCAGWLHDCSPVFEGGVAVHMPPTTLGYVGMAGRIGQAAGSFSASNRNTWNASDGPELSSAVRSGAVIDLTITHNRGSSLKVPFAGAMPSGFQCSTSTTFGTLLAISNVEITGNSSVRITLASDPAAPVYVRYMYGNPGSVGQSLPAITGVADNGSGLIRVTCGATTGQITGGLAYPTDTWVRIQGVGGAALGAIVNGWWQVIPVSSTAFDLKGSSSSGLPAFASNQDLWHGSALPTVIQFLGVPIYDNTVTDGWDTTGLPLRPTYTYLTAV